jgi:hypothetical protein
MADVAAALSYAFSIMGIFVFIVLKFFVAKLFKGWKGLIAKAVVSLVIAIIASLVWNFCPAASVVLIFAIFIVGELIGIGIVFASQYIPYVGSTAAYALSIIAPFIVIWFYIAVLAFVFDVTIAITEIVMLFIPGVGWLVDVALVIVSIVVPIIFPIIQIAVAWGAFSTQFGGLADCVLNIGRTGPIPGTGGISIGATK